MKRGKFSRAQGASSGAETWLIAAIIMSVAIFLAGARNNILVVPLASLAIQLVAMIGTLDSRSSAFREMMRSSPLTWGR